jgi:hypothetical protein
MNHRTTNICYPYTHHNYPTLDPDASHTSNGRDQVSTPGSAGSIYHMSSHPDIMLPCHGAFCVQQ